MRIFSMEQRSKNNGLYTKNWMKMDVAILLLHVDS